MAFCGVTRGPIPRFDLNRIVFNDVTVFGVLNGPGLYGEALRLLDEGTIDPNVLIDESTFELERFEEALTHARVRERLRPKIVVKVSARAAPGRGA